MINLADKGETEKPIKIGVNFPKDMKDELIALLKEFKEIFAWSYQDMPRLDIEVVVYRILVKSKCPPVQQALRRMKSEIILKIKKEVKKQLKASFLTAIAYFDRVANIVPMPKKDRKVRICVDYRDLNWASPKDNFPLPHIDTLIDNTSTNMFFSFMDGFLGYNQFKMVEDKIKPRSPLIRELMPMMSCCLA